MTWACALKLILCRDQNTQQPCDKLFCSCTHTDAQGNLVRGLCSNYLADAQPGQELVMTGPSGAVLLLPPQHYEVRVVA